MKQSISVSSPHLSATVTWIVCGRPTHCIIGNSRDIWKENLASVIRVVAAETVERKVSGEMATDAEMEKRSYPRSSTKQIPLARSKINAAPTACAGENRPTFERHTHPDSSYSGLTRCPEDRSAIDGTHVRNRSDGRPTSTFESTDGAATKGMCLNGSDRVSCGQWCGFSPPYLADALLVFSPHGAASVATVAFLQEIRLGGLLPTAHVGLPLNRTYFVSVELTTCRLLDPVLHG
ncbi:hypothetical protein K3495_g1209 [Podosphaera aphanis]|nr:hypothetical protein K3495_g1209 [Podosphaera aphanis]